VLGELVFLPDTFLYKLDTEIMRIEYVYEEYNGIPFKYTCIKT